MKNLLHFFACLFGGICLTGGLIYTMLELNAKQGWGYAALFFGAALYFIFWFMENIRDRESEWVRAADRAWKNGYGAGKLDAKNGVDRLPL